ncbi:DUF1883 domain-containing protein [Saccharopolyspora sp. NPDC002376]
MKPIRYKDPVEHLYWNLGDRAGGARFEVGLKGSPARVILVDSDEHQAYLDGDEYEYFGDFYDVTPVVLEVPYDDHWYLVVDSNDQRIKVSVTEIFD